MFSGDVRENTICLGRRYLRYIKNCKEYSFTADAIVPKNDGKYKIMVSYQAL